LALTFSANVVLELGAFLKEAYGGRPLHFRYRGYYIPGTSWRFVYTHTRNSSSDTVSARARHRTTALTMHWYVSFTLSCMTSKFAACQARNWQKPSMWRSLSV